MMAVEAGASGADAAVPGPGAPGHLTLPARAMLKPSLRRPVALGFAGSLLLAAFYLGLVTLAQGFQHAVDLLLEDRYFVAPILLGFGIQVGLFVYLRSSLRHRKAGRPATAVAGVGSGASTFAMVACCAHHLADILPVIGLSAAALFLAEYRQPLMGLGIATNLAGIAMMLRLIRRARRQQGQPDGGV